MRYSLVRAKLTLASQKAKPKENHHAKEKNTTITANRQ